MSHHGVVTIGQRTRIEGRTLRPVQLHPQALARAEDRYRVLATDTVLDVPRATASQIARAATEKQWALADIVVREENPWVFDVVVYDLDADPIVDAETVSEALDNLMDTLCRCQISEVAMEAIGIAHGGISAPSFAEALVRSCQRAPVGLRLLLCEPDRRLLEAIMTACARLIG